MDRLDRIQSLVREHVPGLRLVHKAEVPWMRAVGRLMRPLAPDFETRFTTVVGSTVYLPCRPEDFPRDALAATLAHELVHQLDQRRWGPLFYASYALAGPTGRTMRAVWERRGYAVDLMLAHDRGGAPELEWALRRVVPLFAGPAYGWMWAGEGAAERFLRPTADDVLAGRLQAEEPYRAILAAWQGR